MMKFGRKPRSHRQAQARTGKNVPGRHVSSSDVSVGSIKAGGSIRITTSNKVVNGGFFERLRWPMRKMRRR